MALIRQAERFGVPLPKEQASGWRETEDDGSIYLVAEGQLALAREIRREKKEQRDMWVSIVRDVIFPLAGIITTIISLLIAYSALHLKH